MKMEHDETQVINDEKRKPKYQFWVFLILIALAVISLAVTYMHSVNPVKVSIHGVATILNDFEFLYRPIKESQIELGNAYTVKGNVAIAMDGSSDKLVNESPNDLLEPSNELNLTYEQMIDLQEKLYSLQLETAEDMRILYLNQDNKQYIRLYDLFPSDIYIGDFDIFSLLANQVSDADYQYLAKKLQNCFEKFVSDKDFSTESTSIYIHNQKRKVKAISIQLSEKRYYELLDYILIELKEDALATNILLKWNPNFKDYQIDKKEHMGDDVYVQFTTYISEFAHIPLLYEFTWNEQVEEEKVKRNSLIYQPGDSKIVSYEIDGVVKSQIHMMKRGNNFDALLKDAPNVTIGYLSGKGSYHNYIYSLLYMVGEERIVVDYKFENMIQNDSESYAIKRKLDFELFNGSQTLTGIHVNVDGTAIREATKIEINDDKVSLETLTEEEKQTILNGIKEKLKKYFGSNE